MIKNKIILIIGGTGSLGRALIARYQDDNIIIVFSRNEQKQVLLSKEPWINNNVQFVIGDIKEHTSIQDTLIKFKPQVVINTAALKHVDICEKNPVESININILSHINLISAIRTSTHKVESIVFISTDKACKPINTYGMCKAISEKLYIQFAKEQADTKVIIVRYGNVLNSSGSVIPIFAKKITEGVEELPITDPKMTRFIITLNEAIDLINWAWEHPTSHGKIAVPSLSSFKILDLAEALSEGLAPSREIKFKTVGIRPGEKIHEELISEEEWVCTEIDKHYLIGFLPLPDRAYESFNSGDTVATKEEVVSILKRENII